MANQHPPYDPLDPLMHPYQVSLHATTSQQTFSTPMSTTSVAVPSPATTSMSQEDAISARFLTAAVHGDTRAMQQEFHQMLSLAQSRNQDCLFLKQQQEQEVEANHGEMDWIRERIQDLEAEVRRMKGRSGGCKIGHGWVFKTKPLTGEDGVAM